MARVEALEAELRRQRMVFDAGPVVLFRWVAADGWPVEYVSDNVLELFGHPADDFVSGRVPYASVVHPDDLARVVAEVAWNSEAGVRGFEQDYRIVPARGGVRWLYDYTEIVRDESGAVTHYLGYVLDISARREAELAIRRKDEELRRAQKMEALGRLAGGIAHDFNNVLTALLGYAHQAEVGLPVDATSREPLLRIRSAVDRASALTRQLLAFSRHQVMTARVVDLSALVRDALALVGPVLGGAAELVIETPPEPLWVTVDPTQLEQVVVNLVLNARDAMPHGGRILVRTSAHHVEGGDEPVPPGRYAALSVRDEGTGMDAATLARVFEPFFTTKGAAGVGLGLATAYGVVRQSNGHLVVASTLGAGALFTAWLPRAEAPANPGARPAEVSAPEPRTVRHVVLLVEDHAEIREVLALALEAGGHEVHPAADGVEALARVDAGLQPTLLVTDLVMPRLDGAGLVTALAQRGVTPPLVLISGYADSPVATLTRRPQVFLQKPFGSEALLRAIRALDD